MKSADAVLQGLYAHLAEASWQITILVALVLLVSLFARKASPTFRYALWCVVLLRLCIPSGVTLPLGMSGNVRGALQQVVQPVARPAAGPAVVSRDSDTASSNMERARENDLAHVRAAKAAAGSATATAPTFAWRTALIGGWLTSAGILAVLVTLWTIRHGRIVRRLPSVQRPELQALLERLRGEIGVRRPVRLCETGDVLPEVGPMVFGVRKPTIVLPNRMAHEWAPEDLEPLLVHELAHVRRNDLLVNWIQVALQVVWFFHPLVWYANWRIRREREWACDDMAVSHIGNRSRTYCERILRVLEETDRNLTLAMAGAGMAERHNSLSERIMRIMNRNYKPTRRTGMLAAGILAVIAIACLAVASDRLSTAPNDGLDTATRTMGEEARKRLTTFTDKSEFSLRNGETVTMDIKPNEAGVEKLRITVGFDENVTSITLMALAKDGAEAFTKPSVVSIRNGSGMNFGGNVKDWIVKTSMTPTIKGDTVQLKVLSLVTRPPTQEETQAMFKVRGTEGKWAQDMMEICGAIQSYQRQNGRYPENLLLLGRTLPTDVYSPSGQSYGYEPEARRFTLTSCGEDRIPGNEDDRVMIVERNGSRSGSRKELLPLGPDKADEQVERPGPSGRRPRGNCLLAGTVVSEKTGQPVAAATVYLHIQETLDAIFIETASNGTFEFRDIPSGRMSLKVINTARHCDEAYNPENTRGEYPVFTLKDGEQRRDIAFRLKSSYRISGKVLNEEGKPPTGHFYVAVWSETPAHIGTARYHRTKSGLVEPDGSYHIDGLDGKPVYLQAEESWANKSGRPYPPRYWPGTFSREEARKVEFGDGASVNDINITLARTGGIVLEGRVTAAGTDKAVADTMVVVYHKDMLFDRVIGFTDAEGKYRLEGIGPGVVQAQFDTMPQGLVRTCRELDLKTSAPANSLDVALNRGTTISGRIVDEAGTDLPLVNPSTFGNTWTKGKPRSGEHSFSGVPHPRSASTVGSLGAVSYTGETGDAVSVEMLYPTASTFIVEAVQPGEIMLNPMPYVKGAKLAKIMHGDRDVTLEGIRAGAGDRISDVRLVFSQDAGTTATAAK